MNFIFPMAGYGTRTSSLGQYKPFIEVLPRLPILKICLMGLKSQILSNDTLIFVSTVEQDLKYDVKKSIDRILSELGIKNYNVALIKETPPGQALTVRHGVFNFLAQDPTNQNKAKDKTIVINPDQCVLFNIDDSTGPSVGLYFNMGTNSCFFDIDTKDKKIKSIKEKDPISSYASAGIFVFPNFNEMVDAIDWGEKTEKTYNGELHLGPCMEYFSDLGYFKTDMKFDLGNVDQVTRFAKIIKEII